MVAPADRRVPASAAHRGLVRDPAHRDEHGVAAQDEERDRVYFDPAVRLAKLDGLGTLGQFVSYDAMVFHGPGTGATGFYGLREHALQQAESPARGGSEKACLESFLDVRRAAMKTRKAGIGTSRVDTAQRRFLHEGNLDLKTPLTWQVYGETYRVP